LYNRKEADRKYREHYYSTLKGYFSRRRGTSVRTAVIRGAIGSFLTDELVELWRKQGGIFENDFDVKKEPECAYCGRELGTKKNGDMVIDHILSIRFGGTNYIENIQLICHSCDVIKNNFEHDFKIPYTATTQKKVIESVKQLMLFKTYNKKMNVSLKERGEKLLPNSRSQSAPLQTTLF